MGGKIVFSKLKRFSSVLNEILMSKEMRKMKLSITRLAATLFPRPILTKVVLFGRVDNLL